MYKGQGRRLRGLVTRGYWEFRVQPAVPRGHPPRAPLPPRLSAPRSCAHCSTRAARRFQGHHGPAIARPPPAARRPSAFPPGKSTRIAPVSGINQTGHPTGQERPCTTLCRISPRSPRHPPPVSCPVLSQIKPHAPLLVVSFRQFRLSFRLATVLSPEPAHWISRRAPAPPARAEAPVGTVYRRNYNGL